MGNCGLSCLRGCDMCFGYDYDQATISNVEFRKCRKPARCVVCRKPIKPGEQYEYYSYLIAGDFCQTKTCNLCVQNRFRIVKYELLEGCGIDEASPGVYDQVFWLADHFNARRAARHVDLNGLGQNLRVFADRLIIRK